MLYDKRWDKTQTDPFSLESLIAWLETMPANGSYEYTDPDNCALCQYFAAHGYSGVSLAMNFFNHDADPAEVRFPFIFADLANENDQTFGGFLTRARAALASRVHDGGAGR